ncbi:hypothetical protein ACDF64_17465 [Agromyces sp. MMS24-JH15]|uniref:hypothetical protein n=1 Tax=Agromyces sp. MMS24-JH15 TaxID=3243765 RepID=UPI0037499F07
MSIRIPTHLADHATPVDSDSDDGRTFVLRSSAGAGLFEIRHTGEVMLEHGLIVDEDAPTLVVARAIDTGEEVVVFDGGRHGYNAMFADEYDADELDARRPEALLERDGHTVFTVEIRLFDNIDWDDEEDEFRDDDGTLRLITGEAISPERLRTDGFDAVGIAVTTADGRRFDIVEEELA